MSAPLIALLIVLPLVVLVVTIFNVGTWPRGRPDGEFEGRLSVLVPARDEAESIEACIRSIFASDHAVHEVVVYDDDSTDATPRILDRLQGDFDQLVVVPGIPLPDGWVGKPHACHRLAEAATGDVLLYVDADVELESEGVSRVASLFQDYDAGVVTAVPRQRTASFFERLVIPLLHLTYVSWLPLALVWRSSDPRFLAANGQVLAIRRDVYRDIGGFASVRGEVVDDMAICRTAKKNDHTVVFADGHTIAVCRMYQNASGVWEGFSKNLYEGIGGHPVGLFAVVALYGAAFVLPYVLLGATLAVPSLLVPAIIGVTANVATRSILAWRYRQPVEGIILHPVAVLAFFAIAVNSLLWNLRGAIRWSGRTYAAKGARLRDSEERHGA